MPLSKEGVAHCVLYHNPSYTELTLHFPLPPFKNTVLIYFFLFLVVIWANTPVTLMELDSVFCLCGRDYRSCAIANLGSRGAKLVDSLEYAYPSDVNVLLHD